MMKRNKGLVLLLTICMVMVMMPTSIFAAETKSNDIVVLYTNDVHCGVDDNIGYAGLAAYKADKLKETNYVTLVDAGDAVQGGTIGALSNGKYIVDIMNEVGYDFVVPGNHEFDYGMTQFMNLVKQSKAKYICSNFINLETKAPVFDGYAMKTYGDVKVAYVGIDTPEAISKSTPAYFQNSKGEYIYDFCNDKTGKALYDNVQKTVDAAKGAGADYIIAVAHLGIDEQSSPWTSKEVIANTTGISAMIDGHSHSTIAGDTVKSKDGKDVLLTSTGTKLAAIGQLVIKDGKISTSLITDYKTKDSKIDSYIKDIQDQTSKLTEKVIGKTTVKLTTMDATGTNRAIRNQETNLGDFCADAYRAAVKADIGIIQGGGIRADLDIGDITYGDILTVHPWGSMLCKVEATGQQIMDALELGVRNTPGEVGGFLQVSGITFDIDTTVKSTVVTDDKGMFVKVTGDRRVKNIKVGGVDIDPEKAYTVGSTDYILKQQGDGMTMFAGCKVLLDATLIDTQVLINYINDDLNGVVGSKYGQRQGRIGVITASNSNDVLNAEKDTALKCKAAISAGTKITSAKAKSKTITIKVLGNDKVSGYCYKVVNAKGKTVIDKDTVNKIYKTKKLAKGNYKVKVATYTYVAGQKFFGKTTTKTVKVA